MNSSKPPSLQASESLGKPYNTIRWLRLGKALSAWSGGDSHSFIHSFKVRVSHYIHPLLWNLGRTFLQFRLTFLLYSPPSHGGIVKTTQCFLPCFVCFSVACCLLLSPCLFVHLGHLIWVPLMAVCFMLLPLSFFFLFTWAMFPFLIIRAVIDIDRQNS